eukprot:CAMPEP_0196147326 /NCGR_PEP_ID=MMETSP0910-20130528/25164_1 /TAXON_ID=49265 /ORGANISM="Thalassiosira rotula, Strain GSO102" /LENGTH=42 /DNA_ID= /DNA_START= /DNA_END= /DNA_ORIENTATION=
MVMVKNGWALGVEIGNERARQLLTYELIGFNGLRFGGVGTET